jgi:arylsulfatase A-like enzyme
VWVAAGAAFGAFAGALEVAAFHAASSRLHAATSLALVGYGAAAFGALALALGGIHLLAARAGPRALLVGPGLLSGGMLAALLGVRCFVDGEALRFALSPRSALLLAVTGALGALAIGLSSLRARTGPAALARGTLLAAVALVWAPFLGRLALEGRGGLLAFVALVALGAGAGAACLRLGLRLPPRSLALALAALLVLPSLARLAAHPAARAEATPRSPRSGAEATPRSPRSGAEATPRLPRSGAERPLHVILIVIDTLRADHLEIYGYERETMPRLARFARRSVVYTSCLANAPWSLPSHATLLTGLYPREHGAVYRAGAGPAAEPQALPGAATTLAEILRSRGYRTAAVSANYAFVSERYGLHQGFDHWDSRSGLRGAMAGGFWPSLFKLMTLVEKLPLRWVLEPLVALDVGQVPYRRAEEISRAVGERLEEAAAPGAPPLFLLVNYMDAHDPFHPPADFVDFFPGRRPDLPRSSTRLPIFLLMNDDEVREHFFSLYDSQLAYLDVHLGRVLASLETGGLLDEALVLITSDHGEQFLEHGGWSHPQALYQEEVHVPLIVRDPRAAPARVAHPVEQRDVMPWILERLGLPLPPRVEASDLERGQRPKVAELMLSDRGHQSALRHGSLALLRSDRGQQLFDLENDPAQRRDLARADPESLERLAAEWERWSGSRPIRSGADLELDARERDQLRELGYLE